MAAQRRLAGPVPSPGRARATRRAAAEAQGLRGQFPGIYTLAWEGFVSLDLCQNNRFFNCHEAFSFQCGRSGFFYVFANRPWFDERSGAPGDGNVGGAVFNLGEKHEAVGPHCVFDNSFCLRSSYIKRGSLGRLDHRNNAILYGEPAEDAAAERGAPPPLFREHGGRTGRGEGPERYGFTRRWRELEIAFGGDMAGHPEFPERLRAHGYPIGASLGVAPGFVAASGGDFRLRGESPCRDRALTVPLLLPDGDTTTVEPHHVGALQDGTEAAWPAFGPLAGQREGAQGPPQDRQLRAAARATRGGRTSCGGRVSRPHPAPGAAGPRRAAQNAGADPRPTEASAPRVRSDPPFAPRPPRGG